MPEDFVRLNSGELNYLISALQYVPSNKENYLESFCKIDSSSLYAKLFDTWATLTHD